MGWLCDSCLSWWIGVVGGEAQLMSVDNMAPEGNWRGLMAWFLLVMGDWVGGWVGPAGLRGQQGGCLSKGMGGLVGGSRWGLYATQIRPAGVSGTQTLERALSPCCTARDVPCCAVCGAGARHPAVWQGGGRPLHHGLRLPHDRHAGERGSSGFGGLATPSNVVCCWVRKVPSTVFAGPMP